MQIFADFAKIIPERLAGWAPVLGFAALTLGPFGLAKVAPLWWHPMVAP